MGYFIYNGLSDFVDNQLHWRYFKQLDGQGDKGPNGIRVWKIILITENSNDIEQAVAHIFQWQHLGLISFHNSLHGNGTLVNDFCVNFIAEGCGNYLRENSKTIINVCLIKELLIIFY